ncbi:MAG: DUF6443 domain-containing protein [Bacteroidota bacterium]
MVQEDVCAANYSEPVSIVLSPKPVIFGPLCIPIRQSARLFTYVGFNSYQWYRNGSPVEGANSYELLTTLEGDYTVQVEINVGDDPYLTNIHMLKLASSDVNFVRNIASLEENKTEFPEKFNVNTDIFQESTTYFDGFGRPIQQVNRQQSPNGLDVVTPIDYDQFGRVEKNYLPYVSSETNGGFKRNDVNTNDYESSHQYIFYQNGEAIARDDMPFSETVYEPSPLNRAKENGSPGVSWQPNKTDPTSGKTVKSEYRVNEDSDEVMFLEVVNDKLVYEKNYERRTLIKTVTIDEESHRVIEFTNKLGQTALKRVQAVENPDLTTYIRGEWADTYYIYDDYGNLSYVLPPEAVNNIDQYLND